VLLGIGSLLLAGCAASPTVPLGPDGKPPAIACARLTSVYGVGTVIVVDPEAIKMNAGMSITTDGNDCKTTITVNAPPAKAASGP